MKKRKETLMNERKKFNKWMKARNGVGEHTEKKGGHYAEKPGMRRPWTKVNK